MSEKTIFDDLHELEARMEGMKETLPKPGEPVPQEWLDQNEQVVNDLLAITTHFLTSAVRAKAFAEALKARPKTELEFVALLAIYTAKLHSTVVGLLGDDEEEKADGLHPSVGDA